VSGSEGREGAEERRSARLPEEELRGIARRMNAAPSITLRDGEELITLEEASRRLGLSRRTVQEWCRLGKLPVYEISPKRRYVIWSALGAEVRTIASEQLERRHPPAGSSPDQGAS